MKVFGNIDDMEDKHHIPLIKVLVDIMINLTFDATPSGYNTARRLLLGAPIAIEKYKEKYGDIEFLK